jgi:hypothetical protein
MTLWQFVSEAYRLEPILTVIISVVIVSLPFLIVIVGYTGLKTFKVTQ